MDKKKMARVILDLFLKAILLALGFREVPKSNEI